MTTKVETGMVQDGFATTDALAALRSIFVGTYHDLAYEPSAEDEPWYLPCYGQTVLVADYPALFAKLGTTYGGNGTTTFGIPDHRGRVRAGLDNMGGTSANRLTNQSGGLNGDVLGATGGAETHTLTVNELAQHDHPGSSSAITHTLVGYTDIGGAQTGGGGSRIAASGAGTSIPTNSVTPTITVGNRGGGQAHNNVQPTIIGVVCILAY